MNAAPVVSFELPLLLPLLNEWERMHWRTRSRWKQRLASELFVALNLTGQRAPDLKRYPRATVRVERHSRPGPAPDEDNLVASVKPLLDAMQPVSNKRKYGMGLIANDSPDTIDLEVVRLQAKTSKTKVEVRYFGKESD